MLHALTTKPLHHELLPTFSLFCSSNTFLHWSHFLSSLTKKREQYHVLLTFCCITWIDITIFVYNHNVLSFCYRINHFKAQVPNLVLRKMLRERTLRFFKCEILMIYWLFWIIQKTCCRMWESTFFNLLIMHSVSYCTKLFVAGWLWVVVFLFSACQLTLPWFTLPTAWK